MSSSVFQVVCETGDRLIRLAPTLALTCKELYKFRILRRLGARACCLEHVNIPTGYCDKVAITNLSMHVPSLEKSALRMSVIKWQIGVADLQEYLQHRPVMPTALKELEVLVDDASISELPDVLALMTGDLGPSALDIRVESEDDSPQHCNVLTLYRVKPAKVLEVFGECGCLSNMMLACQSSEAREACERASSLMHMGRGSFRSCDAFLGFEDDLESVISEG